MGQQDNPRAHYISVATRKFAQEGYHGVSLAALAREAGVTKQALLHFFGKKERLYAEVLAHLADRLCAEIETAHHDDPVQHLSAYFVSLHTTSLKQPEDICLVIRALMDSQSDAKSWPVKPYLDRLIALAKSKPGARHAQTDEVLGWLVHVLGMVQYSVVSAPATAGMYGDTAAKAAANYINRSVERTVLEFVQDKT